MEEHMSVMAQSGREPGRDVYYPAEDGEPMAETGIHVDAILRLREYLDDLYQGRLDVFISTDQYWYWEEGNPNARLAPDIMVCFGVVPTAEFRRSFFTWLENNVIPQFIIEFSSENTWKNDVGEKYRQFERLGVKEHFLFDPEGAYLHPQLQGWRHDGNRFRPIKANTDGSLTSKELSLRFLPERQHLRLLDAAGNKMLTRAERLSEAQNQLQEARRQAAEKDAEIARMKALLEAAEQKGRIES
jgi:Uma2 family endonuclease